MFGSRRRYNEAVALARRKRAQEEAYAQFCRERAPYLIQIAQAILRAAGVKEPEFFDKGYPMTEGFYLSQLDGEVLLTYHKVDTSKEVRRQMTLQLAAHLRAAVTSVGCLWPIRDFTPDDPGPTVVLGLPPDEQITILYRHFVER